MKNSTPEPMDTSKQFCPNSTCSARGKRGEGNIRIHAYHPQRYRCSLCRKTFSARRGTILEGLRTSTDLVIIVVSLLCSGCPIQAMVQVYGLDERTVADWQKRAGKHCHQVHLYLLMSFVIIVSTQPLSTACDDMPQKYYASIRDE